MWGIDGMWKIWEHGGQSSKVEWSFSSKESSKIDPLPTDRTSSSP